MNCYYHTSSPHAGTFDAVIMVGALSEGQVPCSAIPELLRVTKTGESQSSQPLPRGTPLSPLHNFRPWTHTVRKGRALCRVTHPRTASQFATGQFVLHPGCHQRRQTRDKGRQVASSPAIHGQLGRAPPFWPLFPFLNKWHHH